MDIINILQIPALLLLMLIPIFLVYSGFIFWLLKKLKFKKVSFNASLGYAFFVCIIFFVVPGIIETLFITEEAFDQSIWKLILVFSQFVIIFYSLKLLFKETNQKTIKAELLSVLIPALILIPIPILILLLTKILER